MSLIIMKKVVTQYVKRGIPKHANAKEFLARRVPCNFLIQLTSMKFGVESV